jgi:hypothetical protein
MTNAKALKAYMGERKEKISVKTWQNLLARSSDRGSGAPA